MVQRNAASIQHTTAAHQHAPSSRAEGNQGGQQPLCPCVCVAQRSPGAGARLQVVELQLALLNRLCLAGPTPTDGPQKLFMAQVGGAGAGR
jgi:hypothetical protein